MENGPMQRYRTLVEEGCLRRDPAQYLAAEKLELLANRMAQYEPPQKTDIFSFFTRKGGEVPEGLYMYGGVGRGKTMLMDLFYETVPFEAKRRTHFHEFMAGVHDLIARFRKEHDGDPIPLAAGEIANDARLLCLDELQVTDIADAMILGRLFASLFEAHTVVVATSNAHPAELYENGLNRPLFEPFIALIEEKLEVLQLESQTDYRLQKLQGAQLYFSPADKKAARSMDEVWEILTGTKKGAPASIEVKKRKIKVPEAAMGVARFSFADLCEKPLGPNDYLALAHAYHTVMIDGIPVLKPELRNEAKRFITLIDTLYDTGAKLVASADAEPQELYKQGDVAKAFQRTSSRLIEMRSEGYLARARGEAVSEDAA
ncbi:MAG: cell division protein ZapE [Hyphomicrobiaceae bacterium]|nr:cell division protein ZapE [Hyphomicrobiaceae bacterium]